MLDSALKVINYTNGMDLDSFMEDNKTIDAVIRNFEIIGEASNILDEEFRVKNPEIEWKRIRGFRNRIVHDYQQLNIDIVKTIVEKHLVDFEEYKRGIIEYFK